MPSARLAEQPCPCRVSHALHMHCACTTQALRNTTSLTRVDLSYNHFGEAAGRAFGEVWCACCVQTVLATMHTCTVHPPRAARTRVTCTLIEPQPW